MTTPIAAKDTTQNLKNLTLVLILTGTYLLAEVAGGILTKSLALLADAGHMLTDVGGLAISIFAIKIANRSADSKRTYGYYRAEILGSLVNSVILLGLSFYILFEAYKRFSTPPEVQTTGMLIVAIIGLAINLIGMKILRSASRESLNMKGAYFEVLSDLLTSVGVIIGAVVIAFTGWNWIDPLVSAGIGLFIIPRTWILLKASVSVLLEGTPSDINLQDVRTALLAVSGVNAVHDLHVWSLTSKVNAMSAHLVITDARKYSDVLDDASRLMAENYGIRQVTLQPEPSVFPDLDIHT